MKNKYLIALPAFPNDKGFCHQTILVSAKDKEDAIALVRHLKPGYNIGDIKEDADKYTTRAIELDTELASTKACLIGVRAELKSFVSDYCTKNLFSQWQSEATKAIELLNSL